MTPLLTRDITFQYIGGPTLLIQIGQICFLTDPTFDPAGTHYSSGAGQMVKTRGPAMNASELPPVDVVLLTHDQHRDNLDEAGRAFLPHARRVLTTVTGAERLRGNAIGLQSWGTYAVTSDDGSERVTVTATPARHGPPGSERQSGEVIGFCLEWSGMTGAIYISGDTVLFGAFEDIAFIFTIDTAVLFLGAAVIPAYGPDHRTMTASEAVEAATLLKAQHIIPVHFDGWQHLSEGRSDVLCAFEAAGLNNKLVWLEPGRHTELSRPQRRVAPTMKARDPVFEVDFDRWLIQP